MLALSAIEAQTRSPTRLTETHARISPDGRWMGLSNESGRDDVYWTRFPEPRNKAVSTLGAVKQCGAVPSRDLLPCPRKSWRPGSCPTSRRPADTLFTPRAARPLGFGRFYDVAPDGRFLSTYSWNGLKSRPVVLNWRPSLAPRSGRRIECEVWCRYGVVRKSPWGLSYDGRVHARDFSSRVSSGLGFGAMSLLLFCSTPTARGALRESLVAAGRQESAVLQRQDARVSIAIIRAASSRGGARSASRTRARTSRWTPTRCSPRAPTPSPCSPMRS